MAKVRLDALLVRRGLFESRTRAAAAVIAGEVIVGAGGRRGAKAGQLVADDVELEVEPRARYVSRGGEKLANAVAELGVPISGRMCMDAGASTGGFTDFLLQHGAAAVVAVDVGYGELHWRLRGDERVTVLERTNVRGLTPDALPYRPELVVADLSFIALTKVLPALIACASTRFDMLALVKPQFEVGKGAVGKGGVVRDPSLRRAAIETVARAAGELGAVVHGVASSGLPGPAGNRETFVWLVARGDRAECDLQAALDRVEPETR